MYSNRPFGVTLSPWCSYRTPISQKRGPWDSSPQGKILVRTLYTGNTFESNHQLIQGSRFAFITSLWKDYHFTMQHKDNFLENYWTKSKATQLLIMLKLKKDMWPGISLKSRYWGQLTNFKDDFARLVWPSYKEGQFKRFFVCLLKPVARLLKPLMMTTTNHFILPD